MGAFSDLDPTKDRTPGFSDAWKQWSDENKKKKAAAARSKEISGEIENAQGNPDEFANLRDTAVAGIDDSWHNAGQDTAESYARRGLGGSGMDSGDQLRLAARRASAVTDATNRARDAAVANQRADLSQEQAALVGIQTSDINAQRLAMEQQAYYDQILADAVGALAQVGGNYYGYAKGQQDKMNSRGYGSSGQLASPDGYYAQIPGKVGV